MSRSIVQVGIAGCSHAARRGLVASFGSNYVVQSPAGPGLPSAGLRAAETRLPFDLSGKTAIAPDRERERRFLETRSTTQRPRRRRQEKS